MSKHLWKDERGSLTFEWIVVFTILVIGLVGGYSAVRDGIIDELGDVADAIFAVDQSFTTQAPACMPNVNWGHFEDPHKGQKCQRERPATPPISQE
jgi:hypothetical protein